jgi:hypothetical protein
LWEMRWKKTQGTGYATGHNSALRQLNAIREGRCRAQYLQRWRGNKAPWCGDWGDGRSGQDATQAAEGRNYSRLIIGWNMWENDELGLQKQMPQKEGANGWLWAGDSSYTGLGGKGRTMWKREAVKSMSMHVALVALVVTTQAKPLCPKK